MLLFIGSQWSEEPSAPIVSRSDPDEDEDTDREEPSLFLATPWDEDTHTVTGFEEFEGGESSRTPTEQDGALLAASLESATRQVAALVAEELRSEALLAEPHWPPLAPGSPPAASRPKSAEPEPPASARAPSSSRAPASQAASRAASAPSRPAPSSTPSAVVSPPPLELKTTLRSAGPPPLEDAAGAHGRNEAAHGAAPSAPAPASRQMALTEPIDPAIIASVVKGRRRAREVDTGNRAYSATASLLARGPSPFSRAVLGIAILVVLLAFLFHGGHLTRQSRFALAKAPRSVPTSASSGSAPEAIAPERRAPENRTPENGAAEDAARSQRRVLPPVPTELAAKDPPPASGSLLPPQAAAVQGGGIAPAFAAQDAPGNLLAPIEVSSLLAAPDAGAERHVAATSATQNEGLGSDSVGNEAAGNAPVYLRTEDFEHLREVVDAPGGSALRSSWSSRSARGTRSRTKDDASSSPASAHANTPPPRLIDETDPYPE
jgi:hypothetical protein